MRMCVSFLMLILLTRVFASDSLQTESEQFLKPFVTDYCTAYPEGTLIHPRLWAQCCVEHDLALWAGGSHEDRIQTDKNLRICVRKAGAPINAFLIYWGVRLGTYSPIKFKGKGWGNGWKVPRGHESLSQDEITLIEDFLQTHPTDILSVEDIERFLNLLRQRAQVQSDNR